VVVAVAEEWDQGRGIHLERDGVRMVVRAVARVAASLSLSLTLALALRRASAVLARRVSLVAVV
jgi:hypothetical protein